MKNKLFNLLIVIVLVIFASCGGDRNHKHTRKTHDDLGRTVNIPVRVQRVVSLTPSITEILATIAPFEKIVARTPHCTYPKEILKVPVIDVYPLDIEKIVKLKPDLVFVKEGFLAIEHANQLEKLGIAVYYLKFNTAQDIIHAIVKVGKLMDADMQAGLEADTLGMHLHKLKVKAEQINEKDKPEVLILISSNPLYAYGKDSYASDFLYYAGAKNAIKEKFSNPFPQLSREYLLKLNPEILITTKQNDNIFDLYPELKQSKAFKNNRIHYIDEDLISRPGPRVIEAILKLQELVDKK